MCDANLEKVLQGGKGHFVLDCDESFLATIGADRTILRGLTESTASYRRRLQRALDDLQHAGNAWAVLSQVLGYLLALTPAARTVSSTYDADGTLATSQWSYYDAGDSIEAAPKHLAQDPGEWDWDSLSPTTGSWGWWRWYLVLDSVAPNDWIGPEGLWGSAGLYGDGGAWGVDGSPNVAKSIKIIVRQFKANRCDWVVISFDATEFIPGAAVLPDGHYGRWAKYVNGVAVRARSSNGRYFEGQ